MSIVRPPLLLVEREFSKMNDPHVERLRYRIVFDDSVDYDNASDVVEEMPECRMLVSAGTVTFEMKKHFPTVDEARTIVEEYLGRWEVLIGLECGPNELTFSYQDADVIDRAPSPDDKRAVMSGRVALAVALTLDPKIHVSRKRRGYPSRPNRFSRSLDVETMYHRYMAFKQGREPLTSMAYMCLTVAEASAGSRREAAERYQIRPDVLSKLGEFSSARGSPLEVRKAPKSGNYLSLTSKERNWIEAVIKALIGRVGEWAYDPEATLDELTMDDFPELS